MSERIYVWDPVVRIFHWSLVLTFIICYMTAEEESIVHIYSGYIIIILIIVRIIWGFIGTRRSRFSDFIYSPTETINYLKELFAVSTKKYIGHNPAGGWMIIALLVSLLLACLSGLKIYGIEGHGPLAGNETSQTLDTNSGIASLNIRASELNTEHEDDDYEYEYEDEDDDDVEQAGYSFHESDENEESDEDEESEGIWEEIHEFFANFTLFLVVLHIGGVIFSSIKERQNLIMSMISGYKHQ